MTAHAMDATPLHSRGRPLAEAPPTPRWTARVLWFLTVAFLLFDVVGKLLKIEPVLSAQAQLGWSDVPPPLLGSILLVCVIFYMIPRTTVLGAVLLTAWLGGAVATHLRVGNPLLGFTLFPVYVAIAMWAPLWLRDARVRALLPFRGEG